MMLIKHLILIFEKNMMLLYLKISNKKSSFLKAAICCRFKFEMFLKTHFLSDYYSIRKEK